MVKRKRFILVQFPIEKRGSNSGADNVGSTEDSEAIKNSLRAKSTREILADALEETIDTSIQAGKNSLNVLKRYKAEYSRRVNLDGKEKLKSLGVSVDTSADSATPRAVEKRTMFYLTNARKSGIMDCARGRVNSLCTRCLVD